MSPGTMPPAVLEVFEPLKNELVRLHECWALFREMFGKNEWRVTSTRIYGNYEGYKSVATYKVLWANEWSAVLLLRGEARERVYHIHFYEPWFYLLAARYICEYFRRVPSKRRGRA